MAISLVILAGLAAVVGASPMHVIATLFEGGFGSRHALASTIREAVQLALCALAAVLVVVYVSAPAWITISAALLAAALVGAVVAAPALALKAKRGASEVTTTIMLNFAVMELVLWMVTGPLKDPAQFF